MQSDIRDKKSGWGYVEEWLMNRIKKSQEEIELLKNPSFLINNSQAT